MDLITIPVKPYVKKYIQTKYKCTTWHYTKNDRLGKYVYALLQRPPKVMTRYRPDLESLTIEIPSKHVNVRGNYLDQDAVDDLNEFVYEEIVEGIVNYITGLTMREGIKKYDRLWIKETVKNKKKKRMVQNTDIMQFFEVKEVIFDHLLRFGISENEIQYERIAKNVYRRMKPFVTALKSA